MDTEEAMDMDTMEREKLSQSMDIMEDIIEVITLTMVIDTMDKPKFYIQSVLSSESEPKIIFLKIFNK